MKIKEVYDSSFDPDVSVLPEYEFFEKALDIVLNSLSENDPYGSLLRHSDSEKFKKYVKHFGESHENFWHYFLGLFMQITKMNMGDDEVDPQGPMKAFQKYMSLNDEEQAKYKKKFLKTFVTAYLPEFEDTMDAIHKDSVNEGILDWGANALKKTGNKLAQKVTFGDTKAKLQGKQEARQIANMLMKKWSKQYVGRAGLEPTLTNLYKYLKAEGVSDEIIAQGFDRIKSKVYNKSTNSNGTGRNLKELLRGYKANRNAQGRFVKKEAEEGSKVSSDDILLNDKMLLRNFFEQTTQFYLKDQISKGVNPSAQQDQTGLEKPTDAQTTAQNDKIDQTMDRAEQFLKRLNDLDKDGDYDLNDYVMKIAQDASKLTPDQREYLIKTIANAR